jgi:uncharacterized protein with von Willebrand factor type A (vWA) domain
LRASGAWNGSWEPDVTEQQVARARLDVTIDVPSFAGRLSEALHRVGIATSPDRAVRFAEALRVIPPIDRTSLYWAARLSFVISADQIAAFDRLFDGLFGGIFDPADGRRNPNVPGPNIEPDHTRPPAASMAPPQSPESGRSIGVPHPGEPGDAAGSLDTLPSLASPDEVLAHKDFGTFDDDEFAVLRRLVRALVVATPVRESRRTRVSPRGRRVDLRRSLRRSHRTAGDPITLTMRRRRARRRRLVLLCDVSGSMEPYTRAYLQFFGCAVTGVSAEAFVFATRLTRLTRVLRGSTPEAALQRAGVTAPDWAGGTRIGEALAAFNNAFGRRGMARGAVVVIFSDGWERDAPDVLGREMERLARLAYRIVWVNPGKARPGYAPVVAGMAAALPHCSAFVSGHSLAALDQVVDAIATSR